MNKNKILHRKGHDTKKWRNHNNRNKFNHGNDLPFRESIRDTHKNGSTCFWRWKDGLDFTPTGKYIEENVNRNWNEVYSEIIKKVTPKYRHHLEKYLKFFLSKVIIIDYVPYKQSWGRSTVLLNWTFVDDDGILRNYETTEIVFDMAKKKIRRDKLLRLMEISEEE